MAIFYYDNGSEVKGDPNVLFRDLLSERKGFLNEYTEGFLAYVKDNNILFNNQEIANIITHELESLGYSVVYELSEEEIKSKNSNFQDEFINFKLSKCKRMHEVIKIISGELEEMLINFKTIDEPTLILDCDDESIAIKYINKCFNFCIL